ncbi:MAG TPA: Xaa-Pro peptidase family protein [Chthoniobacterales bacterium]|jgi:Xaa-Pro aminopeptidase|nr:Xaa-Pro peptidase family protein [Chthoniobacterales bacterium]
MVNDRLPRLIFASSEESADLLYATKFSVPDPVLFLRQNGKTTVLLSDLEIDRGKKEAKVDEIIALSSIERLLGKGRKGKPPIERTIGYFLRERRVRKAAVPYNFPIGLADRLAREGVKVVPIAGLFWRDREFKTEEELRLIRRAIRITEVGLARGIEVLQAAEIKSGKRLVWGGAALTSERLRAEIDSAILHAGGTPTNTIVAGGEQACDPHDLGSGPLKADSLIILDVFPKDGRSGYYGDLTRTVVRGKANEAQRALWSTVLDAQKFALQNIRAGDSGAALQKEVSEYFKEKGYPAEIRNERWVGFFHGLGHGIGLEIHEQPRIAKTNFKTGQVLTVEPGLYFPGVGGVRIEDDGVVTDRGFKVLSKFEKRLEV